jgi:1-piperideine-2-carboxylate/1-pyrroline-2-carboxylate reductase [NAD(P)H]
MLIYDRENTEALLPWPELAKEIGRVLEDRKSGRAEAPERQVLPLRGAGTLLVMAATDHKLAITKMVTVHKKNSGTDLAVVQGEVLVIDARNGRRIVLLEGTSLTARRTAALSLLAAQRLAPETGGEMLIIGAGTQGAAHLEAFHAGFGTKKIYLCSRSAQRAENLKKQAAEKKIRVKIVRNPEEVLDRVTLIVTTTTSTRPVLRGTVRDDAFISAAGAFQPETAEIDAQIVKTSRLYADTLKGAKAEAGDYIQASIDWESVVPLEDALDAPRPSAGPVLFKSVGHPLFDLAAARLAVTHL